MGGFILVLHTRLSGAGKVPPFAELPRPTKGTVALSETGMLSFRRACAGKECLEGESSHLLKKIK